MLNITATNITIMVHDMNKSISFYTQILGFNIMQQYGEYYAQISAPGIVIGLHPSHGKPNASENISIGFTVNDFAGAKKRFKELIVDFYEREERGGSFIHFKDPDGTPLYFIEPKK